MRVFWCGKRRAFVGSATAIKPDHRMKWLSVRHATTSWLRMMILLFVAAFESALIVPKLVDLELSASQMTRYLDASTRSTFQFW